MFCLVKNWIDKEQPKGSMPFASFPEWANVCGGIMESAGYDNPCKIDKESLSLAGDKETTDMKQLFEVCFEKYPDKRVGKPGIIEIVKSEELFSYYDFDKNQDKIKFGLQLRKFIGRTLSDINLRIFDDKVRPARQEYIFSKEKKEDYDKKVGSDGIDGSVETTLGLFEEKISNRVNSLPSLPTLPKKEQKTPNNDTNDTFSEKDGEEIVKIEKFRTPKDGKTEKIGEKND